MAVFGGWWCHACRTYHSSSQNRRAPGEVCSVCGFDPVEMDALIRQSNNEPVSDSDVPLAIFRAVQRHVRTLAERNTPR